MVLLTNLGVIIMLDGRLYFLNKPDPNRPIDEKYVVEINGERKSFVKEEDA